MAGASALAARRGAVSAALLAVLAALLWRFLQRRRRKQVEQQQQYPVLDRAKAELLGGLRFAEGPRWRRGRLYFSDMWADEVVAVEPASGRRQAVARFPGGGDQPRRGPSGLGWLPNGTLLVSDMPRKRLLAFAGEEGLERASTEHASVAELAPEIINDMCVAADGSAYIGNFGFDLGLVEGKHPGAWPPLRPTRLARVAPDGTVSAATPEELVFPNGIVITPDGGTLLVAETFGQRVSAYPRAADGSLGERKTWAELPWTFPDGMCLDASGALWVALAGAGSFLRVSEGGKVHEVIPASPGYKAIAVMLGGDDGRTLFMLEAKGTGPEDVSKNGRENSRIVMAHVDVPGATMPGNPNYFAGYC